jgi:hypothetical protein
VLTNNEYYIVADKKTYPTKEEFIHEIEAVYDYEVDEEKIRTCHLRYSPFVKTMAGKGGYTETKPNSRGSFESWEYQYN